MGFSNVLLCRVRLGVCSISSAPCLLSNADPTLSATLPPTAVSSFTLFQVPGHTQQPPYCSPESFLPGAAGLVIWKPLSVELGDQGADVAGGPALPCPQARR